MKNAILGQSFMIPSYALIGAGAFASGDMTLFLILNGLALAAAGLGVYVGYKWINWRYPMPSA